MNVRALNCAVPTSYYPPYLVLSSRPQTVIIALSVKPVLLSLWRLKETIRALWSPCTSLRRLRCVGGLKSSSKLSASRFLCRWTHRCPEGAGAVGGHGGRVVGGRTVHQQRRTRADGSGLQDWQEDPAERAHQAAFPPYVFVKTPRLQCKSVNKVQQWICSWIPVPQIPPSPRISPWWQLWELWKTRRSFCSPCTTHRYETTKENSSECCRSLSTCHNKDIFVRFWYSIHVWWKYVRVRKR